ncbi:hypothetical protein BJ878DRAFT_490198 [Calycina marina]|uniref:Zn(2)-C6 fungal-type domain-containing protein n=1 Tax=Calycina marina TaxID=1763456 RepID=A0A9P7ZAR5_9HELO|nr:hypothetical protein BJ878DRAFT_490198 [Calycina marina]
MVKRSISKSYLPKLSLSEDEQRLAKKPRASKPKVKSGCYTCKARRVKCDEAKPQCNRCLNLGRKCEGYPPEVLTRTSMQPLQPRTTPTAVTMYSPSVFSIYSNEEEARYFKNFTEHSAFELSGFFDPDFWTRIVLQECHQNVPIRHAVMAMGALRKSLDVAPRPSLKVNVIQTFDKRHYEYAVHNYIKSIQALNQYILSSNSPQLRVVLISCLLFVCFETFVGSFASSIQQTYGGLKILKNHYVGRKPWNPSKKSMKTNQHRGTELARALQNRSDCDNVSKDVTMTKHIKDYLESENVDSETSTNETYSYQNSPSEFHPYDSSSRQQTTASNLSRQSSPYGTGSRDQSHMINIADPHDRTALYSRPYLTVKSPHSQTSRVSTPATYTSPSTSLDTPSAQASFSRSGNGSVNTYRTPSTETQISARILHNDNHIEDSLIQTFVRLDGNGMFFGMIPGIPPLIWDIHEKYHLPIPDKFSDIPTAHHCWDFLMDRCLQFYRKTLFNRAYAPQNNVPESEVRCQYSSYVRQLEAFADAYQPILNNAISPSGQVVEPSSLILSIHHRATMITLAAVTNDSEMVYDAFIPDFRYITRTSALLVSSTSTKGPKNPRFSFDIGIVPPLHVTITKCRVPVIRQEAISTLLSSPRQEGMWDGVLTARIGEWITRCEESGLSIPTLESPPIQIPVSPGVQQSYPSSASVRDEGDWEDDERIRNGTDAPNGYSSANRHGRMGSRNVQQYPYGIGLPNKSQKQRYDNRSWTVPEGNRVLLTVVDFHIPDRYIKVKCQKALAGEDGTREQRETVIAW